MLTIGTLYLRDDGRYVLCLEPEHIEDVVGVVLAQELLITDHQEGTDSE